MQQQIEHIKQNNLLEHIELCGRNAYKSEDKITPDSANKFVNRIIKSRHYSVLEHGTVYLVITIKKNYPNNGNLFKIINSFRNNKYSKLNSRSLFSQQKELYYVTTNLRVLAENNELESIFNYFVGKDELIDGIDYLETDYHEKRYSFRVITDTKIAQEIVRHRNGSYTIESTRWINYLRKSFVFIDIKDYLNKKANNIWYNIATKVSSFCYTKMIKNGERPEIARSCLSMGLKADTIITMHESDWSNFFYLRSAKDAHPLIKYLSDGINNIINEIKKK